MTVFLTPRHDAEGRDAVLSNQSIPASLVVTVTSNQSPIVHLTRIVMRRERYTIRLQVRGYIMTPLMTLCPTRRALDSQCPLKLFSAYHENNLSVWHQTFTVTPQMFWYDLCGRALFFSQLHFFIDSHS